LIIEKGKWKILLPCFENHLTFGHYPPFCVDVSDKDANPANPEQSSDRMTIPEYGANDVTL